MLNHKPCKIHRSWHTVPMAQRRRQQLKITIRREGAPKGSLLGSDIRETGPVLGNCALCQEESLLCLSHIVPKWMYQWAKREGGIVGVYDSLRLETAEQDGQKHYLLCGACEQFVCVAERYVSILMHDHQTEQRANGIFELKITYVGVNFDLIQRFLLATLLKAHYATAPPFHKISLSEPVVLQLTQTLQSQRRGASAIKDQTFPILAMKFVSPYDPQIDPRAIVIPQVAALPTGCPVFELLAAGWSWMMALNVDNNCPDEILRARFLPNSPFTVLVGDILDHRFLNKGRPLTEEEKRRRFPGAQGGHLTALTS